MRIICAWCGKCIGFKCNHCGEPLTKVLLVLERRYVLTCMTGPTTIYFLNAHRMDATGTMCNDCLTENGRPPMPAGEDRLTVEDRIHLASFLLGTVPPKKKAWSEAPGRTISKPNDPQHPEKKGSHEGIAHANNPPIGGDE